MNNKTIAKYMTAGAAALLGLIAMPAYSADILLSADNNNYFAETNGSWLADGSLVEMGQFNVSDVTLQGLVNSGQITPANYSTLLADFVPLNIAPSTTIGTGTTVAGVGANGGALSFDFKGTNPSFASGKLYLLVFDSSTTGTAHSVGIFTGDATWNFPANMSTGSTAPDTDQASQTPLIGTFVSGIDGTTNPYNNGPNGNGNATVGALELDHIASAVVVPEPSTIALVGMGLFGAFTFRRRSKKA